MELKKKKVNNKANCDNQEPGENCRHDFEGFKTKYAGFLSNQLRPLPHFLSNKENQKNLVDRPLPILLFCIIFQFKVINGMKCVQISLYLNTRLKIDLKTY